MFAVLRQLLYGLTLSRDIVYFFSDPDLPQTMNPGLATESQSVRITRTAHLMTIY